jgi:hypothetical protein
MSAFVKNDAHPRDGSRRLPHRPCTARFSPQGNGALVARSGASRQEHEGGSPAAIGGDDHDAISVLTARIHSCTIAPHPSHVSRSPISDSGATCSAVSRTRYPETPRLWLDAQFELRRFTRIRRIAPPKALGSYPNRPTAQCLPLSSSRGTDRVAPTLKCAPEPVRRYAPTRRRGKCVRQPRGRALGYRLSRPAPTPLSPAEHASADGRACRCHDDESSGARRDARTTSAGAGHARAFCRVILAHRARGTRHARTHYTPRSKSANPRAIASPTRAAAQQSQADWWALQCEWHAKGGVVGHGPRLGGSSNQVRSHRICG